MWRRLVWRTQQPDLFLEVGAAVGIEEAFLEIGMEVGLEEAFVEGAAAEGIGLE